MFKVMYKKYQLKNKTRKQRVSNKSKKKTGGAKKSTNTSTKTRRNIKGGSMKTVRVNIKRQPQAIGKDTTQITMIHANKTDSTRSSKWTCRDCTDDKKDRPTHRYNNSRLLNNKTGLKKCDCEVTAL
jgi:hypothetical protein